MDKEQARKLLMFVNNPEVMDLFNLILNTRIELLQKTLDTERDEINLRQVQGKIQELKYLKHIRDVVISRAE